MQDFPFLIREPLLNARDEVLGYAFAWQTPANKMPLDMAHTEAGHGARSVESLLNLIVAEIDENRSGALLGEQELFISSTPALLKAEAFRRLPSHGTVIGIEHADLADAECLASLRNLRAAGYAFSLREVDLGRLDRTLLPLLKYLEVSVARPDFAAQVQQYRTLAQPAPRLLARDTVNWQHVDICTRLGMDVFVGGLHLTPRPASRPIGLNPAQTLIMNLMEMVRQNADVRQLEGILKRDAALSYKLLRYINSAGFGLGCEIQSLKHAVTMLGYSPLYRWLALLLATATSKGYSPVLMQTAVIRGRFAEQLGQLFLPKQEAENLFVAGMFSMLDKLLGMPMEDVLEKVQLSGAVSEALLTRGGIYGPFLAMAEACEVHSPKLDSMAMSLCMNPGQVSKAHLSALVWAQNLKL